MDIREIKEKIQKGNLRILMIYPEFPPTYWGLQYAVKFVGAIASMPPLGLLTIAKLLPNYCEVKLVDMNVSLLSKEDIRKADIVFISAMIAQKNSFKCVANTCKEFDKIVVAGGPYPSSCYQDMENVDSVVIGEAERVIAEIMRNLEEGCLEKLYKDSNFPPLTESPIPMYDLLPDINAYATMSVQYSRGCPYSCEFCDIIKMFGRKMRTKTVAQIIAEMEQLYKFGWRGSVFIVDDNFIGKKKTIKTEVLPAIARWQKEHGHPFDLFTETSIDVAEEELLKLLADAGFNMLFIGFETVSKESLEETGKNQNLDKGVANVAERYLANVLKIQQAGIEVTGGFIVGFDNDPKNIFDQLTSFIQSSGIVLAMVGLLSALPGTKLYKRLKNAERLLGDSSGNNTHDLCLNFKPLNMSIEEIISGYKEVIAYIYNPKNYFQRCLMHLRNVRPHKTSTRRVRKNEILALFKSLVIQSWSPYRWHYWKFLFHSLFIKPKMFPETIRLAIMGHHFFKITEEILAVDAFEREAYNVKKTYWKMIEEAKTWISGKTSKIQTAYTSLKKEDIEAKIVELQKFKTQLLKELKKRYYKIDVDFRHYVEDLLINIEKALNDYLNQLMEVVPSKPQQ